MAVTGSGDSFTHISGNHEITTLGYSNVFLSKKMKKKKKDCDCNLSAIKLYISAAASYKNQQKPSLKIVMVPILYSTYLIFLLNFLYRLV